MGADHRPDPERLQALADAAQQLADNVAALAQDQGVQLVSLAKRARSNRRMIVWLGASVAVDVLLTAALGFGGWQINANAREIDDLTHRLDVSQTTTRKQALCPLYSILLDSQSAAGRAAAPDPKKYDNAFRVIKQGYEALDCDAFIAEPQGPPGSTPTP